ncbi:hypothetical protein JN086_25210 [Mycolicibacterium austroafricanum]|uniref:Uncharacterized protein n=1 Tax=Mycolicibacterium austroafricanum TaxID=39687 RepID=A0ABT8HB28_MYCAO|nr:hypothetical protein [Mycolicibacterium austroafricanum]MDN4517978.1 hypothetical protein [Mycolicibacterium austroafricanum]PQP49530.1 hypothetical protein C6A88_11805 [Mycolicibacterium austroafricanum]QRZ06257.1 hypothetical protein JN090_25735 [Mycolicibacterium austroafricanum]QZT67732.1 hypothetical protein JN086_25210 [Mycolicibacterium austroafricanum]
MAEAGLWVAWGVPTRGRERNALDLLVETEGYLSDLQGRGRIEGFDRVVLKPQSIELGGFILIRGSKEQIDGLRRDHDFELWLTRVQLVADQVGVADAWLGDGIAEAVSLYEKALENLG